MASVGQMWHPVEDHHKTLHHKGAQHIRHYFNIQNNALCKIGSPYVYTKNAEINADCTDCND